MTQAPPLQFNDQTQLSPPKTVPVSVCLIVKDCADKLKRCLGSLRRNFLRDSDELLILDTGSRDNSTIEAAKSFGATVISRKLSVPLGLYIEKWLPEFKEKAAGFESILDFASAREVVSNCATHDIQLWIDADDELVEQQPGTLRDLTDKVFGTTRQADSIFLDYLYGFDQHDGSLTTILKRERVYDRRKYKWVGRCHETCIPREGTQLMPAAYFPDAGVAIRHCKDKTDNFTSDLRNYVILRKELEDTVGREDPRTIFYLGNASRGLKRFGEALELYNKFVPLSGSPDDIYSAVYYSGILLLSEEVRRPFDSLDYMFRCIRIKPHDPRGYYGVARCYFQMGQHQESLHWFRTGRLLPEPKQDLHSYDPSHIDALPLQVAILAAKELKLLEPVCDLTDQLRKIRPNHPDTKAMTDMVQNFVAGQNLVESVRRVAANSAPGNQREAIKVARQIVSKLPMIPKDLEDMGLGRLETVTPDVQDIVFFCGPTAEEWGPENRRGGIGGSEKMVIEMAPRLARRGRKVAVYASIPPNQRGLHDGVEYRHWSEFDDTAPRHTMIYWRHPSFLEKSVPCERRIVWCHDVCRPADWTDERIALADEVWVLSEFQATTLGPAREKLGPKLWVTRNGLDSSLFDANQPREKRVVYCSSPERGLLTAIRIFQKANVPGSSLHVYYGFNKTYLYLAANAQYGHFPDIDKTANYYDYMKLVYKLIDEDERITMHGRIGFEEMAKELCKAQVWLYPTRFDEISCMSAMEAQAAGLAVVATDKAALAETILWPYALKISLADENEAAEKLQKALELDHDSKAVSDLAKKRFDLDLLADEWYNRLKIGESTNALQGSEERIRTAETSSANA
jgi:glycosyltransferase involved in cell wall biosynthesis/tetratricopeptide (TPR) repeat protein